MLLGVAAAVYAFERREIIRQTWGTYAESENVKVPFLVSVTYFVNLFSKATFLCRRQSRSKHSRKA